ncbi:MAG: class I SAM-dependent methyltransferase [Acidobacteriota bacterium]
MLVVPRSQELALEKTRRHVNCGRMAGRDYWLSIASAPDADDLREHILTGFKSGKPFTPYVPTIALPSPLGRVLDFGCGVGRTFPYLKRVARHVTGFDLPPMIERCRALAAEPADQLLDDWAAARLSKFDLIVSVLVLQHIEPASCAEYVRDFASMAPVVYLLSRVDSDFGTNVFAQVAAAGVFEASECVEVDHDPRTHQLRVLGTRPFDEVCRPESSGHYEVLLRTR